MNVAFKPDLPQSVASIGECMLELSRNPASTESWKMGFAGDTFNTIWAIKALISDKDQAHYVSAFGDDPFSQEQLDFFTAGGIGTAHSPRIAGARPGLYAITLTGAERSFTYWRNDAAARQLADDPDALAKSLHNQNLVYFSGITLAILARKARSTLFSALETARSNGSTIAFDPNYRPRLWTDESDAKDAFTQALGLTDIALPTFPDEQALFGDKDPDATAKRLLELGVSEAVVKNGEFPCVLVTPRVREEIPALKVTAVDTTGAGDSFNGGYLAARLRGFSPAEAVRHGHKVAGAVVQVRGALAPFETLRAAFNQA